MTSDIPTPPATPEPRVPKPRVPWDAYRRITAWGGLIAFPLVIAVVMPNGDSVPIDEGRTVRIVTPMVLVCVAAVIAGLISGSRFFALYAGYARHLTPTDALSSTDAVRGANTVSSLLGDCMWGALIAGIAGGVPGTIGFVATESGLFGATLSGLISAIVMPVILLPLLVLVIGMAWMGFWAAGAVVSLIVSAALGIVVGSSGRADRLLWILIAVFLPLLLVAAGVPIVGSAAAGNNVGAWTAILAAAGFPLPVEFAFGPVVLWIARIAIWIATALFAVLVVIGTPPLLRRLERLRRLGRD